MTKNEGLGGSGINYGLPFSRPCRSSSRRLIIAVIEPFRPDNGSFRLPDRRVRYRPSKRNEL